jgi:hypothetical protein
MLPVLQEHEFRCLFFATGASLQAKPSMLWYEELYLMLLDASGPIMLNVPEAEINSVVPTSHGKHPYWWNLVEQLS